MGFKTQQIVLKMDTHGLKSGSKELWPFEKKLLRLWAASMLEKRT